MRTRYNSFGSVLAAVLTASVSALYSGKPSMANGEGLNYFSIEWARVSALEEV